MVAAVSGEGRTRRGGLAGLFGGLSGWPDQRLRHGTVGEPARREGAGAGAGAVYRGDEAERECENGATAR